MAPNPKFADFRSLNDHLLTFPSPLTNPPKANDPSLTPKIASLELHPTLEAALHILNNDLPSAHFLVRHMQSAPAYEGMFLHGILHRIEGDYNNARLWYGDVKDSDVFRRAWPGGEEEARGLIKRIEDLVKKKQGDHAQLECESLREIQDVVEFCREKFGEGPIGDATGAYPETSEKIKKLGEEQTTGSQGFRDF